MNKTVKTIAWICLVLGVMGLAADAFALVRGRMIANEVQAAIEAGELPVGRFPFGGKAAGGDFDKEAWEELREEGGGGSPGKRGGSGLRRPGMGPKAGGFGAGRRISSHSRPLFWMALGPVLVAVGAVILIVNREPKKQAADGKKAKK